MQLISSIEFGKYCGFTALLFSTLIVLAGCDSQADIQHQSSPYSQLATMLAAVTLTPEPTLSPLPETTKARPMSTPEIPSPPTIIATAVVTKQSSTAANIAAITKPDRNLMQLATRYGFADQLPARTLIPTSAKVGDEETFWVANQTTNTYFQVRARLVIQTERASFWAIGSSSDHDERYERAAAEFENLILDTIVDEFGFANHPTIEDFHVNILHASIPGVAGYYSSSDEYPAWVNRHSNQRKMIYINTAAIHPDTASYYSVIAHELMHALQWMIDSSESTWVNEGTAELAADAIYGLPSGSSLSYLQRPSTQLTGWVDPNKGPVAAHYGGGYLFFRYLADILGGFESIGAIIGKKNDSIAGVESYLREAAINSSFDDLFADWTVANFLQDTSISNGQYGYSVALTRPAVTPASGLGPSVNGRISPFAVHYLELTPISTGLQIDFEADPEVKIVPVDASIDGGQWWSNRGDSINTRLTRPVDLSAVSSATLKYRIWYDIEKDFDYGYLSVSTDNGLRWQTIGTPNTTISNPNGQNYGNAYNGERGAQQAGWVDEVVDLTQFAGKMIQLRFEYVTDDAYVREGFGIEGIKIDGLGWKDGLGDTGWRAEGFVWLTDNRLSTRYRIALIRLDDSPQIEWLHIDEKSSGRLLIDPDQSAMLIIINTTRLTNQPSGYQLNISQVN